MAKRARSLIAYCAGVTLVCGCSGTERPEQIAESTGALTVCPAQDVVRGVDVSAIQGQIDWATAAGSGLAFGFARIADGANHLDPRFDANWSGMRAAGLTRGAFQLFEPTEDPASQAQLVVSKLGELATDDLPVALDIEVAGGMSEATIGAGIQKWVDDVTLGTKKRPLISTSARFWNESVAAGSFGAEPLWTTSFAACPSVPTGWSNWEFWMDSDSAAVPGIPAAVDEDQFNGSIADLHSFANGSLLVAGNDGAGGAGGTSSGATGSAGVATDEVAAGAGPEVNANGGSSAAAGAESGLAETGAAGGGAANRDGDSLIGRGAGAANARKQPQAGSPVSSRIGSCCFRPPFERLASTPIGVLFIGLAFLLRARSGRRRHQTPLAPT